MHTLVAFIIKNPINPIYLCSFTIKSRSAQRRLRKIWLPGEIFVSHAHDTRDVNVAIANSTWPIIGTEVLWDIMS